MKFVRLLGGMVALFVCACQVHADGCQSVENKGWLRPGSCALNFVKCLERLEKMIGSDGQDDTKLKNGRAQCIKDFDKIVTTKQYANCVSVQCGICDERHKWYEAVWPKGPIARRLCHWRQKKHCHAVWMGADEP